VKSTPDTIRTIALLGAAMALPLTPVGAGVFGSPKFAISQPDDRFSTSGTTTWSSEGNRISKKSIAGGTHIDQSGVFLDPAAVVNRTTGKLELLSLAVTNVTQRVGGMGELNALGRPIRVSFLTGEGDPIVLNITGGDRKYGETHCSQYTPGCATPLIESGLAVISVEDYRRLLAATALAVRIEGSDRSHVYETKDIAPTFIPNLRLFFESKVAGGL
jgi:hypothetical protein